MLYYSVYKILFISIFGNEEYTVHISVHTDERMRQTLSKER